MAGCEKVPKDDGVEMPEKSEFLKLLNSAKRLCSHQFHLLVYIYRYIYSLHFIISLSTGCPEKVGINDT